MAIRWPNAYGDQMGRAIVTTDRLSTSGDQMEAKGGDQLVEQDWRSVDGRVWRSIGRPGVVIQLAEQDWRSVGGRVWQSASRTHVAIEWAGQMWRPIG